MANENIGKELLKYAKEEGLTVRGALEDLFPFIYAVSDRMSTRKVSQWLEEKHDVKISYSAIAKALQKSDTYIQQTASSFYGDAAALDFYIPKSQPFSGLDVLDSITLFNVLKTEDPLRNDSAGMVRSIIDDLDANWFSLPKKYRESCMIIMREQQKQGIEEGE